MGQSYLTYGILGSLSALASAAAWAFGSILFRRLGNKVSPLGMTFIKSIIGILYLGAVILLLGIEPVTTHTFIILALSGILGIALGDTFFFKALISLGPRLTLLLGTLGPVVTVILAVLFLQEKPSYLAWVGIFLTTIGVTWVLWERAPREKIKENWISGIKYALLSALCISLGIIFAKIGVVSISALQATFIRFLGGLAGLILFGFLTRNFKEWLIPFKDLRLLKFAFFTVFVVIFGGFWLFLVALKYIDASIAATLNSTTPLFIIPMAVFIMKEKVSFRAIIGAGVAVSGIVLIFFGT